MSQRVPASAHRLVIHVDSTSIYVAVNKIETRELSISNYMRQLHWKLGWNNFYFLLLYSLYSFVKKKRNLYKSKGFEIWQTSCSLLTFFFLHSEQNHAYNLHLTMVNMTNFNSVASCSLECIQSGPGVAEGMRLVPSGLCGRYQSQKRPDHYQWEALPPATEHREVHQRGRPPSHRPVQAERRQPQRCEWLPFVNATTNIFEVKVKLFDTNVDVTGEWC